MAGGGKGRKEDPLVINSTNVFAALGSLKKKKKKGGEKENLGSSSKSKGLKGLGKEAEKKEVFWAPTPLKVKSWADVDEEDDDDYYASMAPSGSAWGIPKEPEPTLEESESEEDGLDEVDDEVEEEHENEAETPVEVQLVTTKPPEASAVNKEAERQLSKKELKKKGLEELDAVLAELGYTKQRTSGSNDSHGDEQGKISESNGKIEKKEKTQSAKKKKKKDKSSKEVKESSQVPGEGSVNAGNDAKEDSETNKPEETPAVDVKERLKKVASAKKKKSSKEMDAAARAAANEAAARSARLAAAKKKEKNHYNQQPVR
ncbi:hypothetical protein J1N35_003364 [Gossypium stocksii]|uniref:Uncharacterized protein n=1 Tax=Gossypium stocksii TaxID=47602 RepID=A0A9D4ANK0_9ROSI|nr:hypothetical protein J1N35_003364 [Gossypium stocksii]